MPIRGSVKWPTISFRNDERGTKSASKMAIQLTLGLLQAEIECAGFVAVAIRTDADRPR